MQSYLAVTRREGWESSTKSHRRERGEKVGGETAKTDERKPLPTCMLSKLIPPSAAVISFLSA